MSNALAVLGGFSFCANPGLSGSLHFGGFFFLRRCNGRNCFLSPKPQVSQFIPVLWGGNSRQKGGAARGFEGSSDACVTGSPDTCVAGLPKACFAGLPEACGCRRFGAFFPCFGIKSGIRFYSIPYFSGFNGVYQLIANHLLVFFGVVWRAVFACCGLPDGRQTAPLFLSPRQGGRGCEFPTAPLSIKWVSFLKNIIKKGYSLRDLSKTHFARLYLTTSRCVRPMSSARRIASCFEHSNASQAFSMRSLSASLMRTVCANPSLSNLLVLAMPEVLKMQILTQFKKRVKYYTFLY